MTESKAPEKQISEADPRWSYVAIEVATTPPPGLIEHLKDRWWAHVPGKGLVFWNRKAGAPATDASPQCNHDEATARALNARLHPWAEVIFVPSVFRKINPRDYA